MEFYNSFGNILFWSALLDPAVQQAQLLPGAENHNSFWIHISKIWDGLDAKAFEGFYKSSQVCSAEYEQNCCAKLLVPLCFNFMFDFQ